MLKSNQKRVKIVWHDAISYRTGSPVPHRVTLLETTGLLAKEDNDYVLIENPVTVNTRTGKRYPDKQPTFYFIPRGMIEKIEKHPLAGPEIKA